MKMKIFFLSILFAALSVTSFALTKPEPGVNTNSLSYFFYLYYDNGQLFADRDIIPNYDIINETFIPESLSDPNLYKLELVNFKFEIVKEILFDPKRGNAEFKQGKITVKAPYLPDGLKANFYDHQNNQLVSIFINTGSICNDDDFCNNSAGENETTCPNDCKRTRTPAPFSANEVAAFDEGLDIMTLITYSVGGLIVLAGAWFGWKWWKKRKEGNFTIPPAALPLPKPEGSENQVNLNPSSIGKLPDFRE